MKKIYEVTIVNGDKAKTEKVIANSKRDSKIKLLANVDGDEIVKINDITPDVNIIIDKISNSDVFTNDEKLVLINSIK